MKSVNAIFTLLLVLCPLAADAQQDSTTVTRSAQGDACKSENDSITWNKELDGVVVKAQRQLIKQDIDRIAYDVQHDEESKTQTVMDMLRKVPMVTVDGQDNIQVKGNSNFKVYKNGHLDPSLTKNAKEVFKAMPASAVKRSFLKGGRLTVRLTANAPFNKYWTMDAETINGDFTGIERSWNRNRSFSISASWRFGSLKSSVKKTEHTIENSDVVGGISKGK